MTMAVTTTIPVEWIDANEAKRIFGLGKTSLYKLKNEGRIRTSNICERGKTKGKRLFFYDSLKKIIEENAEGGEG